MVLLNVPCYVDCQAQEAEERKAEASNNPLKNAVEAYALTARDIEVFIEHFGAMDVERRGKYNLLYISTISVGYLAAIF